MRTFSMLAPTAAAPAKPAVLPPSSAPSTVQAQLRYTKRPPAGERLFTYLYEPPKHLERTTNVEFDDQEVSITDLRSVSEPFTLQHNGFQLVEFPSGEGLNWNDEQQVKLQYYPEVREMLKRVTGATRVEIFDHTLRNGHAAQDPGTPDQVQPRGEPVQRAHVDYTVNSGPKRLADVTGHEWEKLSKTPYAVIQIWRPLNGPVQSAPLGMADAATVDPSDLMPSALHFPGRTGEVYVVAHNPKHRWYYARGIRNDEAYVFVCYDSRTDGRARFTPHSAFADPLTPAGAPPRASCETRAYVFWEDEPAVAQTA